MIYIHIGLILLLVIILVKTPIDRRRKTAGFVTTWANAIRRLGQIPLYSHKVYTLASARLAHRWIRFLF